MIHYKKEYDTPYGVYTIVSYGPYKPGERIDNTPISPDSIAKLQTKAGMTFSLMVLSL